MVVAEQVQPRLRCGEDFVDLRLAGVGSSAAGKRTKGLRSFMAHQDVDVAQRLCRIHFFADEMASFVRKLGRPGAPFLGMRQISGARLVPRRREGSSEPGHADAGDIDRGPVANVMEIRWQIAGGDGVEVVVVAVDPVDPCAERLVSAEFVGDVADAQPDRDLGMPPNDGARRVERAVDVAERAYCLVV